MPVGVLPHDIYIPNNQIGVAHKCVINVVSDPQIDGSRVEAFPQPATASLRERGTHSYRNGMSDETGSANPNQTNTYKADGGIWLIYS